MQLLKQKFEEIKNSYRSAYDFDNINEKVPDVRTFMIQDLDRTNTDLLQELTGMEGNKAYVSIELDDWIKSLERSFELNNSSSNSTRKRMSVKLGELLDSLKEYQFEVTEAPSSVKDINNIFASTFVGEHNKPSLSRQQVIILMHLLKKNRVVINDLEDTRLAVCFSGLTGFKADSLRKIYSSYKKEESVHSRADVNKLKEILVNMIADLSEFEVK